MAEDAHFSELAERAEKPGPWLPGEHAGVRRYRFTYVSKFEPTPWVVDVDTGGERAVRLQRFRVSEGDKIPFGYQSEETAQEGFDFWLDQFSSGAQDRADMLVFFAESPENIARNADNLDDGIFLLEDFTF